MPRRFSPILKKNRVFRPINLFLIGILLFVVLFTSAYFELRGTKDEIFHIMKEEASTLIASLEAGGANSLLAYSEIELLEQENLRQIADQIREEILGGRFSARKLRELSRRANLSQILLLDAAGTVRYSTGRPDSLFLPGGAGAQILKPVLLGQREVLVLGFEKVVPGRDDFFAVARHLRGGGAVVLVLDPAHLLEVRKRLGIGKLLEDLSQTQGIRYLVLQDTLGILAASQNVREMSSIESDPFLFRALEHNDYDTRVTTFGGENIYEVVRPFVVEGQTLGLFRIGLKMNHILAANRRLKRRFFILSLAMLLIGIILINFLMINQNYALLNRSFKEVQTYTGNILENMADAVLVVEAAGKIMLWNRRASELFGRAEEELLGKKLTEIDEPCFASFQKFQNSASFQLDQEILCTIGGKRKIISARFSRLQSPEGKGPLWVAIFRDVTERRNFEERLQRQEKLSAMGELAAGVAHEIRNPLNAIGMIAQRFRKEFTPVEDVEEYRKLTQIVVSEIRRVNQIIQQFLQFARPPKLDRTLASVDDFLQEVLSLVEAQAQTKGIQIKAELQASAKIPMDKNQLKQAFLNLLQNALEATPNGGEISLKSSASQDEVDIEVSDSGHGIPEEQLPKIFNLYFSTKPSGTGVGLSLVNQIISAHGGSISVESKVGKGTTFFISLPRQEAE